MQESFFYVGVLQYKPSVEMIFHYDPFLHVLA